MARDALTQETYGPNVKWLNCPMCEFEDEVWYTKKPPVYCSDKCKQKAYRARKQKSDKRIPLLVRDARQRGYGFLAGHLQKYGEKFGSDSLADMLPLLDMTANEIHRLARNT